MVDQHHLDECFHLVGKVSDIVEPQGVKSIWDLNEGALTKLYG
jgi:hypothetical protein